MRLLGRGLLVCVLLIGYPPAARADSCSDFHAAHAFTGFEETQQGILESHMACSRNPLLPDDSDDSADSPRPRKPDHPALRQRLLELKKQDHPEPPASCATGSLLQRPLPRKGKQAGKSLVVPPPGCARPNLALQMRACVVEHSGVACWNLARINNLGVGTPTNAERAAELFGSACEADFAPGCADLGEMYEAGRGLSKDAPRAFALYRRACEAGESHACGDAALYYDGVLHDVAHAIPLWRSGCDQVTR
jgi:hypothetical protein